MYHYLHDHGNRYFFFPCLCCHPHSYIRMVQHLIERCLILHMSREECVKALAYHASISPLVTLIVWKELQKENKDFFQAYIRAFSSRPFIARRFIQRGQGSQEGNNSTGSE